MAREKVKYLAGQMTEKYSCDNHVCKKYVYGGLEPQMRWWVLARKDKRNNADCLRYHFCSRECMAAWLVNGGGM